MQSGKRIRRRCAKLDLVICMIESIFKFQRTAWITFFVNLLFESDRRSYLFIVFIFVFYRFYKRFESSFVEHLTFNKLFQNKRYIFFPFVLNPKIKPLKMTARISIRSHIQMIFFTILSYILKVSTLKIGLKNNFSLTFDVSFTAIIENYVSLMFFHKLLVSIV